MKQNRGFTLVELLVVVAIVGILSLAAVLSISTAFSAGARRSAVEVNSLISRAKVGVMSRGGSTYACLRLDADGYLTGQYIEGGAVVLDRRLSRYRVDAAYQTASGEARQITVYNPLYIGFEQADGGLCIFGSNADSTIDETERGELTVSSGGRTYTIVLDALTGSHGLVE